MEDHRIEPTWLDVELLTAIHDRQLAEHGGPSGTRDAGALESALGRPINRWAYGEDDRCALAAAYGFGIARKHPYTDGNKRTAWIAVRVFLALNGYELDRDPAEAIETVLALAAGKLTEDELAAWLRKRVRPAS